MPRPVVCPNCREELDIPDALRGRPVRCAACQATFTPPVDDAPSASRRPEPRDDPRDDDRGYRDDDRPAPRRESRYDRRPAPRRSLLWLWLTLFGVFGVCCVGCGGFLVMAVRLAEPSLKVTHKSTDGRFEVAFPGPVTTGTKPTPTAAGGMTTTTTVEHQRRFIGTPVDRYFVHSTDLKKTLTGRQADAAVKKAVDEMAGRLGSTVRRNDPTRTDGADGVEVDIFHGGDEATVARVFVSGDRLYVVGVTGKMLEPEQQARLQDFWASFKLIEKPADADKAKKEPAEEE